MSSFEDPLLLERINSFSLVSYIPGALGDFLTALRQELVSGCIARSHVTILPPRPLAADVEAAESELRLRLGEYPPFHIVMPRLRVFRETSVIFADIGQGRDELLRMHAELRGGPFAFEEPYPYHPHITLAQGIDPAELDGMFEFASRKWRDEAPARSFLVDTLTFVQNTAGNRWMDLSFHELRGSLMVPAPVGQV